MHPATVLAVDAGQTAMKLRLTVGGTLNSEIVLPGVRLHEPLLPQLIKAVCFVAQLEGPSLDVVSFGVSGLTKMDMDPATMLRGISEVGAHTVMLAHDSVTSFLGALGDSWGAVIAAGTGVVTLGVGRSNVARVDGWGNIMGDAGSAYWIGRQALEASMRAHDGRGPATLLTAIVEERWLDIEDAYIDLQGSPDRIRIVAGLSEKVAELSETDAIARQICLSAAEELAHSVGTALKQSTVSGDADVLHVSAVGGVFRSELIGRHFNTLVRQGSSKVIIKPPLGNGLDGAAALPGLASSHPLRTLIAVASVGQ